MPMKALLLDRDGVVNVDHGYVCSVERFSFVDGIFDLTRRAVDLGYRVVVITNQSGIARGYYTELEFHRLSHWMTKEFERHGVTLAGVFHCPYHAVGTTSRYSRESYWRKPNPGMILEAQRLLGLDLARSAFVGDQPTDMAAARAAGVGRRVFFGAPSESGPDADRVVARLAEAAALLT
jgi:D-glycero-D-manno-heptose 1,7-bisphosphate phosphatase